MVDTNLLMRLEETHRAVKDMEEKSEVIHQQIHELQQFEAALGALAKNESKEILASVGKGVFVKSEMQDGKLFVDVGSGVLVRKTVDEAKAVVGQQLARLQEVRMQLVAENESLQERMQELIAKAEQVKPESN